MESLNFDINDSSDDYEDAVDRFNYDHEVDFEIQQYEQEMSDTSTADTNNHGILFSKLSALRLVYSWH